MKDSRDFFNDMLWFEIGDISFTQHYNNKTMMGTVILSVQLIMLIVCTIIAVLTHINLFGYFSVVNCIMFIFIIANNYICDRNLDEARKRQCDLMTIKSVIDDGDLSDEDVHLIVSALKGYKVSHSDSVLQELVYKWAGNLKTKKREKTGYKDSKGLEYCVGDIVFNSSIADIWYIDKLNDKDKNELNFEIPYAMELNGTDAYVMELDEPEGFEIVCTPRDRVKYIKCMVVFIKYYKWYNDKSEEDDCEVDFSGD